MLFVGRASRNIGGLTIACDGVRQRKRCNRLRVGCHSISRTGVGRGQVVQGGQVVPGGSRHKNNAGWVSIFIYLHWPILMNNMSTEDDCNSAACGLIQLRGSAVLNENAIESINYYSDECCTGTPLKSVEAVDATESIINNSDGCHKATTSNHRNPSRDLSGDRVAQRAGVVTIEAYDELVSKFALKKWLKYKDTLGEYPNC